jgi:hypothetical protein
MSATYVYGLVAADTEVPSDLVGLGPDGRVSTVTHRKLAALVSALPTGRPIGTRDDLMAHDAVVEAVARTGTVIPTRFPAVVEQDRVVDELLAPNHDHFVQALAELDGRVQFTLKGRYDQDAVLREVIAEDPEVHELRERVRGIPEDASYHDRVRLGELTVRAFEAKRDVEAPAILARLSPYAVASSAGEPGQPDDVISTAFLVDRTRIKEFVEAVEDVGKDLFGRVHLKLLGPLAPYDFVPEG